MAAHRHVKNVIGTVNNRHVAALWALLPIIGQCLASDAKRQMRCSET
jgi:hypothetical protein